MPDYKNGKIYCIRNPECDMVYIGSTVQTLCDRLTRHTNSFKLWKKGIYPYTTSFKLFEVGEPTIELLEDYPCDSKAELDRREGEIIKATENCVNKVIPGRTPKEWRKDNPASAKKYRENNRESLKQKAREYRNLNKDRINQKQRDYREAKKKASLEV